PVGRLQRLDFSPPCYPSYGALALAPAGLFPAERTDLTWTHNPASDMRADDTLKVPATASVERWARGPLWLEGHSHEEGR
ncbi:MAG: hypothetical protein AB1576_07050, partial [Bacillota bacterium]